MSTQHFQPDVFSARLITYGPGILLAISVAITASVVSLLLTYATAGMASLPAMVLALGVGIVLHPLARRSIFQAGLTCCIKVLLRWAIGLLGLRIALQDIAALGFGIAFLVILAMLLTMISALYSARLIGRHDGYGALVGAACAVCGASAALATATVIPNYSQKTADIAFTVVAANALSTLVMVFYPPLCVWLGLSAESTGILLGATIHDMAQVVGAGYGVSEQTGNTAVIVKLCRVFLLLPMVLLVAWYFMRQQTLTADEHHSMHVPVPIFALVFMALCCLNSLMPTLPSVMHVYLPIKGFLSDLAGWGMLVAISALGLGTSVHAILRLGWRHMIIFLIASMVILGVVVAGLKVLTS